MFFVLFICVVGFSGFVYAIASAACEFLYRKNNEYYEIKKGGRRDIPERDKHDTGRCNQRLGM